MSAGPARALRWGSINRMGVRCRRSIPRASEFTSLGAKGTPFLQLKAFPSRCSDACNCGAAGCVNSVYVNECVCIRVCEYVCDGCVCLTGFSFNPRTLSVVLCTFYRLTKASVDARGRRAPVSSPTGHLGVNRWKPGQPIQKNSLSDSCHWSLCFPLLERRRNAKSDLPIPHLKAFWSPSVSSKTPDIGSPKTKGRKFGRGNREIVNWKKGEGRQSERYRGKILTIPLPTETTCLSLSAYLHAWPEPRDLSYVLGLCSHTTKAKARIAVVQFTAWSKYFDSLENNLSKAEVKSIHCVKF